ncbi:Uma2 family endonuclease [Methylohalobius crimeensis]|uniref:Uma2 family endonuclease n=1 Tax=Methylohalobius crimeensis TaxID=244365 RepID=UPI0003B73F3E|nr:Uma2 family endonuclease [Methylohalobius crimeensis]
MVANLHEKRWTYKDYLRLEDNRRYEIIEGELRDMTPAPSIEHQWCSRNLEFLLLEYARRHQWGYVFDAPVDVILDEANVVQPDIVLVREARRDIIRERGIFGAPDGVVEIISPSSVHYDYIVKKELYEGFGVAEYWIVDPANRSVEVLGLEEGHYRSVCFVSEAGEVTSQLLAEFKLSHQAIFERGM